MDSGTTINLFGNPNMITNRQRTEMPMNFMTNACLKIVYEVGEITGSVHTNFHPEMIKIILILNEMTKKYWVKFDPGCFKGAHWR